MDVYVLYLGHGRLQMREMLLQMVDLRAGLNSLSSIANVIQSSVQNLESDMDMVHSNLESGQRCDVHCVQNGADIPGINRIYELNLIR